VTSQAHESAQRAPAEQLPGPLQLAVQATDWHWMPKSQAASPMQLKVHDDAVPQSSGPQAFCPLQFTTQSPEPHCTPKKQLRSPMQFTLQLVASPQSIASLQP
jgi:hypothetical protein